MVVFAKRGVRPTVMALTVATASALLLSGTAQAATPVPATSSLAASPVATTVSTVPQLDPRRRVFRAHFRTYGECAFFANHDRNPRTNGWDCRHGGDRVFPWEYWY